MAIGIRPGCSKWSTNFSWKVSSVSKSAEHRRAPAERTHRTESWKLLLSFAVPSLGFVDRFDLQEHVRFLSPAFSRDVPVGELLRD